MKNNLKPLGYQLFFNHIPSLLVLIILVVGCQSQRNVVKSQDGKLSVDKETVIKDLNGIIDPESELTSEEKTALLKAIKDHGFQDAQVDSLIIVAENALMATSGKAPPPQGPRAVAGESKDLSAELENVLIGKFNALTDPDEADDSNDIILETLAYFESNDSPVLIILQKLNGKVFYDRPTTIEQYLYYLKDLKKNHHEIEEMNLNNNDKIDKLILASY